MTKEQKYKSFVDAMSRVVKQGYVISIHAEFDTLKIVVPGVGHYHCIDDRDFPVGTTNWLNSLKAERSADV